MFAVSCPSRVIMKDGNSLDTEIENARSSPRQATLPTGSRAIAKSDTDGVRIHFADIAAGKVRVTD